MSAQRWSSTRPSLLAWPLQAATAVVLTYPAATVALALALGIAALAITWTQLGYRTSRLDLLNPDSDYNRLWIDYINEFGDDDDAVVVVEGANRDQVVQVLDDLSSALAREDRLFHAVLHGVDLNAIRSKGLHYLSVEELEAIERFLSQVGPIIEGNEGNWSRLNLVHMVAGMCRRLQAEERAAADGVSSAHMEMERLTQSLLATLGSRRGYQSPWPEMPPSFATLSELNSQYLLTKDGTLGFVLLRLARDRDGFARNSAATDALRALIAQANARHPATRIGLTGLPIMENDEMRSSQSSMYWASLLSLAGVACLFVAGFGGVRHALLANLVLLLGIAWSFGYLTLAVGHVNILSVSFTVTLIGIGIDYGVYYVARYLHVRAQVGDCRQALLATTAGVGPAILTGAITTSIAFFCAGFTEFKGIAELGIIAGGGILLCAAAELLVLPAVILLVDRGRVGERGPAPLPVHAWVAPLLKKPRMLLASTLAFTVVVAWGLGGLSYDHNLLNLQAAGLESVELERKLLAEANQSVWYALSIADSRDELLRRKASLLKLDSVERIEEIVSLLPSDHAVKRPIIERIGQRLTTLAERPPTIPIDDPDNLGRVLGRAQSLVSRQPQGARLERELGQVRDELRRLPLADCSRLMTQLQQQMAGDLLSRLYALRAMADPSPPQLSDLPESLVKRFVGENGRHLLKIYGRGNIWDMEALSRFVHQVRSVDPRATGNPLQAYEASLEMKSSFEVAALYALAVIVVVLLIDFGSLRHALLAAVPLGLGVLQLFGLLGILDIPLNPANMIALPLILGIGVDYGVHIVHEFRDQPGPFRITPGTAVAVLVDALTTIVGFGSLMIASHQGLQSLGRVLVLGVSCCLFTSLVMLPALLTLMSRGRAPADNSNPGRDGPSRDEPPRKVLVRRYDQAGRGVDGPHMLPTNAADRIKSGRGEDRRGTSRS